MPQYAAEIEFAAPEFSSSEFRVLRKQLVAFLAESDGVGRIHADPARRVVTAGMTVNARSSSTAQARAGAVARALKARLRAVRTGRIRLRIGLTDDERARAEQ